MQSGLYLQRLSDAFEWSSFNWRDEAHQRRHSRQGLHPLGAGLLQITHIAHEHLTPAAIEVSTPAALGP